MKGYAMSLNRVTRWSARAAWVAAVLLVAACNDATVPKPPEPAQAPKPKTSMVPSLVTSAMAAEAPGATASAASGAAAAATSASPAPAANASSEQIARGKYLARAADCAACHTSAAGAPFAGGVPLKSPFGTFYGTNITPDKTNGIGGWTADDFYRALHDGVAPDKALYPAMPYTSYRQMTRADSDAIYAYLMSVKPIAVPNRKHDLSFPYNMRFGMRVWDWMFLKDTLPDASKGQSADWLRGRYLANALGHCAECHTPRGTFGQLDKAKPLGGAALARIAAPDLTPEALAARGWTVKDLQTFFGTGIAPQGSAFGEMYPVVHLSTQYLTPDDLRSLSTYLLGDAAPAPKPLPDNPDTSKLTAGRNLYLAVCAGCHAADGTGKPHVAVSMLGNSTVRQKDPRNLIVAILDGIEPQKFPGLEAMQDMPGFDRRLTDAQIAELSNYLRVAYGGQAGDVNSEIVKQLRQK
ncbi:gluconate 2-dehydrogenase [Pandoraea bronchicola]|uniref:Gluconate 2-dehydrogenase n=2 Tax=Pandoraea bronchicola TaxID=2508287 RepID=A0A5E5BSA8_9BURK|nr:gluconate 2-dehydrogenase [Pandoraea bronchicola]